MKKILLLFAIMLIASFSFLNAQNVVIECNEMSDQYTKPIPFPNEKADCEMKFIGAAPTQTTGFLSYADWTPSACISYSPLIVGPYVGGVLEKIVLSVSDQANYPLYTVGSAKVWVKHSLSGAVVYEQLFTPVYNSWNTITLTTPQTIPATGFVIGFSMTFTASCPSQTGCETYIRSFHRSDQAEDPNLLGGFYYICSNNPDNYKAAVWNPVTTGNLALYGVVTGCNFPDKDMAALGVSFTSPNEFKMRNELYTYSASVLNLGITPQSNFTLQLVDDNNNVLAEKIVPETVASGTGLVVDFEYAAPSEGKLTLRAKVVLEGDEKPNNDVSGPTSLIIYTQNLIKYIPEQRYTNGYYGLDDMTSCAIGYLKSDIEPLVGKLLTGIVVGFWDAKGIEGYMDVWVSNSLEGEKLWIENHDPPISGYNYYKISEPILLEHVDTYIGWTAKTVTGTPNIPVITINNVDPRVNGGFWVHDESNGWNDRNTDPAFTTKGNLLIIGLVRNNISCDPVTDLEVKYNDDCEAVITWEAPEGFAGNPFNVYRDGVRVATKITEKTFTDKDFDATISHVWYVTLVCEEDEESDYTVVQMPKCEQGIVDNVKTTFNIFPNPSQGNITITSETVFNTVEMINFLGQTVLSQQCNTNELSLDLSNLNNGIYFVRITSENGVAVQKFVKN